MMATRCRRLSQPQRCCGGVYMSAIPSLPGSRRADDERICFGPRRCAFASKSGKGAAWAVMTAVDRRQLVVLTLGQVVGNLGIGVVAPILPALAAEIGIGALGIGAIIAAPNVARMLFNLPAGVVADKIGRVPTMVGGEVVFSVGVIGFAGAGSLPAMLPFRVLVGLGSCFSSSGAQAYSADVTGKSHLLPFRGTILGVQSALIGIAYILGPAIGGMLAEVFSARVAYGFVGVCGLACAAVFTQLPETVARKNNVQVSFSARGLQAEAQSALAAWRRLLTQQSQHACIVANVALNMNWILLVISVPLQADLLGLTPWWIGLLFGAGGALSAAVAPAAGALADKHGRASLVTPSLGLMALSCCALAAAADPLQLFAAFMLWSAAEGVMMPGFFAFAADLVPEHEKAQTFALHRASGDVAWVFMPLAMGLIADVGGPAACSGTMAVLTAVAAVLFRRAAHGSGGVR